MSALPLKADIGQGMAHVRFVPEEDIDLHSIRSPEANSDPHNASSDHGLLGTVSQACIRYPSGLMT